MANNFFTSYPVRGVPVFPTISAFPTGSFVGELAVAADTGFLYEWNGSSWMVIAGGGTVLSLGPFGSTPNADGLTLVANVLNMQPADGTHPGGVSITAQTLAGQKTFSSPVLVPDGTLALPGIAFSSEPSSGLYRAGTNDVVWTVGDAIAIEATKSSSGMNFGFGAAASNTAANPLIAATTLNGVSYFQYYNQSTGSASGTVFEIDNGIPNLSNATTLENYAYANSVNQPYLSGASALSATTNQTFLAIMSENPSGYIGFNVGGRTLATQVMKLTTAALLPTADAATNLGSASLGWNNLYVDSTIFQVGGSSKIQLSNDQAYDNGGVLSLDWAQRELFDSSAHGSVLWDARKLKDSSVVDSVTWNSRFLVDSGANQSLDWGNRLLIANDGSTTNLDWHTPGTVAMPSIVTMSGTSSGTISVKTQANSGTYNFNLPITAGGAGQVLTSQAGGSTAMTWTTPSTGTVTSLSVASANGFAGTVANPTTTPVITVSTTINAPALAGNGTAIGAATTTGSGSTVVLATGPTMTNPVVGTQSTTDNSTKAASTAYVTTAVANAIAGVNPAVAVQAATTAAGDTSGFTYNNGVAGIGATFTGSTNTAVTIDGFTFTALNQRLLVKNDTQSPSGAFNGVYYVTQVQTALLPPILTRALDYDTPSDINNTGAIPVVNGTVNGTTSWLLTSSVTTVGTDPLTYTKFSINPSTILTNPMTTAGDMIYGGASGTPTRMAAGTSGQVPVSTGSTVGFGTLPGNSTALKAPTAQVFTSTGTQTGWLFNISTSTTCAVGDTYTNNGHTFTVQGALTAQSGFVLFVSGTGTTTTTGTDTLTRATGSGTSSITFNGSTKKATATYTTPSSPAPLYLEIEISGGGGGGSSGQGAVGVNFGNAGDVSYFGPNILIANGGGVSTGAAGNNAGSSGAPGVSSPAISLIANAGTQGSGTIQGPNTAVNNLELAGSPGGSNALGGGGYGAGFGAVSGGNGIPNTGGGGGGGGSGTNNSSYPGVGGTSGAYIKALIPTPGASYPYFVGAGGTGGSATTGCGAGGNGAAGIVIVKELYQ